MKAKHRATLATLAVLVLLVFVVGGRGDVGATPPAPGQGAISAARLSPPLQSGGTTVRIDYGSKKNYTDKAGNLWLSDRGYLDGETVDRGNIAIANTEDDQIYQTERYNVSGYTVPAANGNYTVRLHFSEGYSRITGAGQRVFNMYVEGVQINNIDVFAEAGGKYIALIKTVNVTVIDGQIDIGLQPIVQYTLINGIEVLPAESVPTATSNPPPTNTSQPPPPTNTRTNTPTKTSTGPTNTPADPTNTPTGPTNTPGGPTNTPPVAPTDTPTGPTSTPPVPPTSTPTSTTVPGGAPLRPVSLPLIIKMLAPPPPPPSCGDAENADDTPNTAGRLAFDITCMGSLQADELYGDDWFYVDAPGGRTLVVDLSGMPAGADYDLFLFDSTLDEVASLPQIGSNAPEHIEYKVNTAGRYYIRIVMYQKSAAANTYLLRAATR